MQYTEKNDIFLRDIEKHLNYDLLKKTANNDPNVFLSYYCHLKIIFPQSIGIMIANLVKKYGNKHSKMMILFDSAYFWGSKLHEFLIEFLHGINAADESVCLITGLTLQSSEMGLFGFESVASANIVIANINLFVKHKQQGQQQYGESKYNDTFSSQKFDTIIMLNAFSMATKNANISKLFHKWKCKSFKGKVIAISAPIASADTVHNEVYSSLFLPLISDRVQIVNV